ncbi:hypothetical protein C1H76_5936 [Elsinoe australis]|uniref:Auxiliary Activity family 9 catalytic domain-containing protein n=1 Tax=Elsinoe australis TaxID=40998 RepID=A0A4V6DTS8_9PEZI|nr:hypothetical protein C1H76_5936 [Elsinoe australis]
MYNVAVFAAVVAALVHQVAGHTAVEKVVIDGNPYQGFYGDLKTPLPADSPAWHTNQGTGWQPVKGDSINKPDIIAHIDAEPSPNTAKARAGSEVTFHWSRRGICKEESKADPEVGWDCSHHGWTTTYLAPCNDDCAKVDKTQLKFFKIHESAMLGYPEGTRYAKGQPRGWVGKWGTDAIFYDNGNNQTVTLPSKIPCGNYTLRTEVASIHNNGPISERQIWPQAFNIRITGGEDSAQVPEGVLGTAIYKTTDELLTMDLYDHEPNKIIENAPGPALYTE